MKSLVVSLSVAFAFLCENPRPAHAARQKPSFVGEVIIVVLIYFNLPFSSGGVPWEDDFDWNAFNFTPLVVGVTLLGIWLAWIFGANKRYTGPIRTIEFEGEGMGIKEIDEPDSPSEPPAAPATT